MIPSKTILPFSMYHPDEVFIGSAGTLFENVCDAPKSGDVLGIFFYILGVTVTGGSPTITVEIKNVDALGVPDAVLGSGVSVIDAALYDPNSAPPSRAYVALTAPLTLTRGQQIAITAYGTDADIDFALSEMADNAYPYAYVPVFDIKVARNLMVCSLAYDVPGVQDVIDLFGQPLNFYTPDGVPSAFKQATLGAPMTATATKFGIRLQGAVSDILAGLNAAFMVPGFEPHPNTQLQSAIITGIWIQGRWNGIAAIRIVDASTGTLITDIGEIYGDPSVIEDDRPFWFLPTPRIEVAGNYFLGIELEPLDFAPSDFDGIFSNSLGELDSVYKSDEASPLIMGWDAGAYAVPPSLPIPTFSGRFGMGFIFENAEPLLTQGGGMAQATVQQAMILARLAPELFSF